MMYKELVEKKKSNILAWVLIVLGVFIALIFLQSFRPQNFGFVMDLAVIMVLSALAYIIIKYCVTDYEYVLIDTDLIFIKHIGSKQRVLFNVDIADIQLIAKPDDVQLKKFSNIENNVNLCHCFVPNKRYSAVFKNGTRTCMFTFQPSEKLLSMLSK